MAVQFPKLFQTFQRDKKDITRGDAVIVALLIVILYLGIRLAFAAPAIIEGLEISLAPSRLPWYALLSVGRMTAAYLLSLIFTIFYGRSAAYNPRAERLLMPLLDVLQSVPILSFLPVVLLSLNAILPEHFAAELASIILIFTSQVWNLTFAWFQSLTTIPKELKEASSMFRLTPWMRFKTLELPFGMISLIWNSMMSWAGGWFFLMAAEIFTVGSRDFRLPGLGSYLHEAANRGNLPAIFWGLGALILTVVLLDQLVWRPLIAWSDRFQLAMSTNDNPPTSWFFDLISQSRLGKGFISRVIRPVADSLDRASLRRRAKAPRQADPPSSNSIVSRVLSILLIVVLLYGLYRAGVMLIGISGSDWANVGTGVLWTFLRVLLSLILALLWTIPVGIWIGTNRKLAAILQPIVQVTASVPATALFPVFLLVILNIKGGINIAAVILMLMGTQWYLLFNIIAGASAIPQDLMYTTKLMHLSGWDKWRTLLIPAIFPYLVTGAITASGGAWNASIVAEYQNFSGQTLVAPGIGSLIAQSTASGNYPVLLAATIAMITTVILVNRLFWRRFYRLAEEKYRME